MKNGIALQDFTFTRDTGVDVYVLHGQDLFYTDNEFNQVSAMLFVPQDTSALVMTNPVKDSE